MTAALRRSVTSLSVPNYRRYFAGQIVSISGNWMQMVAEMWLLVRLTGSGFGIGLAAALQFLPILLLGAFGGVLADRHDKRRLLMLTQSLMVLPAASGRSMSIVSLMRLAGASGVASIVSRPDSILFTSSRS